MATKITMKPTMKQVRAKYKKAIAGVTEFKPMFGKIAIFLDRWNKLNFKTQGGKVGGWKPLKAGGRWKGKGKRRSFDTSAKILQDTGRLRLSYLPFQSSKEGGIGSELSYAEAHNDGFGRLPQRRMLPEKSEVIDDVMRIADLHTKQQLNKVIR